MAEDRFTAQGGAPAMPGIGEALPFFARRMLAAARTPAGNLDRVAGTRRRSGVHSRRRPP